MNRSALLVVLPAALCIAWMNPTRDRIAEANRLFKQGKYDAAITKYGEVLVDHPDSPLLNFNMGDANYKAGKYDEALASFARVRGGDDQPKRVAKTAYNEGNAQFRLAAAAEADKPQDALKAYAGALVAYRRAIGADPTDQDAKYNYEFTGKKLAELKKKLEEQKKQEQEQKEQQQQQDQQQQQQDQQQQDQQHGDQQQQDQQQAEKPPEQQPDQGEKQQQAGDEKKPDEEQQQQQAAQAAEPKDGEKQDAQQQAAAGAGGKDKKDQMSPQEAAALVDTAKNDELQPEEFARQVQGAAVAEPAQDW